MTKVINKKALLVLFTLVLAFCWLTVPASAAEVESNEDFIAQCVSITRIGDVASPQWGGTVDSLMLEELTVKALGRNESSVRPVGTSVNGEFGYAKGPAPWLYCALSDNFYNGMVEARLNKFVCHLKFSVDGTQLQRYIVKVDGVTIVTEEIDGPGVFAITWVSQRKLDTDFSVAVETYSTKATVYGRYRADAYYN